MINRGYSDGYRALGCQVVHGGINLSMRSSDFDLIHVLWPEQFSRRAVPSDGQLKIIEDCLRWWKTKCPMVLTANNLRPHVQGYDPQFTKLYDLFYRFAVGVHHFSESSQRLVCETWEAARDKEHRVTTGFTLPWLLEDDLPRSAARRELGFDRHDRVVLVLGSIRSLQEIEVVARGFKAMTVENKKLLLVARFVGRSRSFSTARAILKWQRLQRRGGVTAITRYVADQEIAKFVQASDVMLTPRFDTLNSGTPGLAMTFGPPWVGPNREAYRDWAASTENRLCEMNDPVSVGRALDHFCHKSSEEAEAVRASNRRRGAEWTWDRVARACLDMASLVAPIDRND